MVNAKHCCSGTCPSDLRYPEKLPKSLEENMRASGQKVFIYLFQNRRRDGIEKSDGTGMSAVAMR